MSGKLLKPLFATRSPDRKTRYVAIKCLKQVDDRYYSAFDRQQTDEEYEREKDIMIKIARHKQQPGLFHEGLQHLMSADAVLQSKMGQPLAFVIEPLTISLYDLVIEMSSMTRERLVPGLDEAVMLPPSTIKRLIKGMLLGLEFLHDRIEVIYLGRLDHQNGCQSRI